MLEIKDFSKAYSNGTKAVDSVNLSVGDGEIFGFIGHNGAGKTTTIKCMVGILKFTEGDILINRTSVKTNALECKKQIAYIPDNPDLYESLKAIDYLNFLGDIYDVEPKKRLELIKHYAKALEIEDRLGDVISSFSHGMKQKIAIVGAFMHSPKLVIMDEPFVGLDPAASFNLKKLMRDYCDEGNTIFYSTHVLEVAEKLSDSIGILKNGKLVLSGKTSDLVSQHSLEDVFMATLEEGKEKHE